MGEKEIKLLEDVVNTTQSELILFFIIMGVVLVSFMIPVYTMMVRDRKHKATMETERLSQYIEREKNVLEVISSNTTAVSKMCERLERDGERSNNSLVRVHERIDLQNQMLVTQCEVSARMIAALEEIIRSQVSVRDDVKALLVTSGVKALAGSDGKEN